MALSRVHLESFVGCSLLSFVRRARHKPCDRRRFVPTWLRGKAFTASKPDALLVESKSLLGCFARKLTESALSEKSATSEDLHS